MLNLRKKLLVSIFTLMLALVAVSTTTYAWFTFGNVTEIDGMKMEVQGAEGLELKVVKINGNNASGQIANWSTSHNLSATDLAVSLTPLTLVGNDLKPIASVEATTTAIKEQDVTVAYEGKAQYGNEAAAGNYLEITFGFKTLSSSPQAVIIEDLESLIDCTHSFETSVALDAQTNEGVTFLQSVPANYVFSEVRAANAIRLAYEKEGNYKVCDPADYQVDGITSYGHWAGAALEYFNKIDETETTVEGVSYPVQLVADTEYEYDTVLTTKTQLVKLEKVTADNWQSLGYVKATDVGSYVGTVTIRIWLEGWDADCFNAVAFDKLIFNINFTTVEAIVDAE